MRRSKRSDLNMYDEACPTCLSCNKKLDTNNEYQMEHNACNASCYKDMELRLEEIRKEIGYE
jgi:hypothetical protein